MTQATNPTAAEGRTREEIVAEIIAVAGDRGCIRGRSRNASPTPACDKRIAELFSELASLTPASPSAPATAEVREREEIVAALRAWSPLVASGYEVPAASTVMNKAADILARFPSLTAPASAASWQYTSAVGEAAQDYIKQCWGEHFAGNEHRLPSTFFWHECFDRMVRALTPPAASQNSGANHSNAKTEGV